MQVRDVNCWVYFYFIDFKCFLSVLLRWKSGGEWP